MPFNSCCPIITSSRWFAIDIGCTFTDVILDGSSGRVTRKVLTTVAQPEVGLMNGAKQLLTTLEVGVSWPCTDAACTLREQVRTSLFEANQVPPFVHRYHCVRSRAFALSDSARIQTSRSSCVFSITSIAFGWIGSTTAFGDVVRKS